MAESVHRDLSRGFSQLLCVVLLAWSVARVLQVLPAWIAGEPSAYPGQFELRLLSGISMIGILGSVLVSQSSWAKTTRGRAASTVLMGVALIAIVADILRAQ